MRKIDRSWIAAHPLPPLAGEGDKNSRGRVLVLGGAEFVPGALRLTGEAALRAGAGKLQMATVRAAAMSLAVLVPEAAVIALPADKSGEISLDAVDVIGSRLERCDVVIIGPGMSAAPHTAALVRKVITLLDRDTVLLLDAAALTCARELKSEILSLAGRVIITPHHGELSHFMGVTEKRISADPIAAASDVADSYRMFVLLKSDKTVLAAPGEEALIFEEGCIGLATGGSGDVLAGLIGGLMARGAAPLAACAWGTYIHGAAGTLLSRQVGTVGFLARELLPLIPRLLGEASRAGNET